jgi:type II secretory ATPase GspE/PulE/Tfp pilus assembly ATPase PilB-like protein
MVGELLDFEVANLSFQAALTGHLVCTSMHANDTASVITRLLDWGIEPFIISSALIGVTSQRLVRRICANCKEPTAIAPELLKRVRSLAAAGGYDLPPNTTFYKGRGCDRCRQTGYKGRIPIYEFMPMNQTIADAILRRASATELTDIAIAHGTKTLVAEGLRLAVDGTTSVEEVMRVMFTA